MPSFHNKPKKRSNYEEDIIIFLITKSFRNKKVIPNTGVTINITIENTSEYAFVAR